MCRVSSAHLRATVGRAHPSSRNPKLPMTPEEKLMQLGLSLPAPAAPAGSYVPITTPVLETVLSTSFSPAGTVPSANSRLPDPMTTGKVQRMNVSRRL